MCVCVCVCVLDPHERELKNRFCLTKSILEVLYNSETFTIVFKFWRFSKPSNIIIIIPSTHRLCVNDVELARGSEARPDRYIIQSIEQKNTLSVREPRLTKSHK